MRHWIWYIIKTTLLQDTLKIGCSFFSFTVFTLKGTYPFIRDKMLPGLFSKKQVRNELWLSYRMKCKKILLTLLTEKVNLKGHFGWWGLLLFHELHSWIWGMTGTLSFTSSFLARCTVNIDFWKLFLLNI